MSNQEHAPKQPEQQTETHDLHEHHEALKDNRERAAEQERDRAEDGETSARHEALEKAASIEKTKEARPSKERSPAERRRGPISKTERNASYKATMREVQRHMSAPERAFSAFIHHPIVDEISEALGSTIARPNAILAGAVAAFLFSLGTLLIAKYYGYRLSGFEAIAAFIGGWLIGIIYDFLRVMITGKK